MIPLQIFIPENRIVLFSNCIIFMSSISLVSQFITILLTYSIYLMELLNIKNMSFLSKNKEPSDSSTD